MSAEDIAELIPVRLLDAERDEQGHITVLQPRRPEGLLGRLLAKGVDGGHLHVALDEVGSAVWEACDGSNTVRDIAALLSERFGEDFDPEHKRLALFVQTMKHQGYLDYRDPRAEL